MKKFSTRKVRESDIDGVPSIPEQDFKSVFETVPGLYLIFKPDFAIAAVSNACLDATMTKREAILGYGLFDVFPDNPDDKDTTGKFAGKRDIQYPPKVVLLDIQIPKVNGIEVLQKIKSDPRTKSTPVVILTSSKENPDIQRCYDLRANSYIVKPVNFESFAQAIKNLGLYWLLLDQLPT